MEADRGRQAMAAIGLLADEPRQRLYRFVRAQPTLVTRDQAAAAAGISRKLAAFHLAKLVSAGLLETAAPRPGQPPPRPRPKACQPVATEVAISVPQRRYDALGEVLAQAIVAEGPARSARTPPSSSSSWRSPPAPGNRRTLPKVFPWALRVCRGGCCAGNQLSIGKGIVRCGAADPRG